MAEPEVILYVCFVKYILFSYGYSASSADEKKKFEKFEVRCGCLAHIKFKVDDGIFEVIKYISDHNHAFIPENQRHLIRCGRIMSETCKGVLADMVKAGIGGTSTYKFLANEARGSKNLGFNLRDYQNYLQIKISEIITGGDCQNLLNHFHSMEQQNPMFSYAIQVDKDGRLTNIFWRDSLSKFDYDCFGDVLIFDTTYRTNKYEMIRAPFVGVNHHWKNVLFGCAFLLDETAELFIWLFDAFLKSMGNKAPKIIFTDQDQAMAKAIRTVFSNIQHCLCTWHIGKNANQNIPHLYKKPGFKDKYFSAFMYRCRSEDEFEFTWREMEKEWGTENNSWLRRLYGIRHKWSLAFGLYYQAKEVKVPIMSSRKTSTLMESVHYYEEQVKHMREIESQDDYSCCGKAKAAVPHDILKHAASVYTRAIFKKFNDEFTLILLENISSSTFDGLIYSFTLKCRGSQRKHVVKFDPTDSSVSCECKSFESKGWLCRHALKVLSENISIRSIPSTYILKRWTKCTKQELRMMNFIIPDSSKFNRFSTLIQQSFELMSLGAEDENTMKIVGKSMEKAKAEISLYKSSADVTDDASGDDDEASLCNISILDPLRKKGKGLSYGRLKSSSEKKKKKSKKGISSTSIEKLVVQVPHDETHFPNYSSNSNQFYGAFCPTNIGDHPIIPNFHNQMQQPPYITSPGIMSGFCPFPSQMQSPYIMPSGIMNGISPFTNQILEYHNRSHRTILSQESSNLFQHPVIYDLNDYEGTQPNRPK
ncbi:LOW QUALITY PROTEIN: hypothetical protein BT93_L3491 [Corymbia citriodora subsp. variegata]|uniref:SWIM-type domain-containing protein n=1 Tax=Corymbia citriodora subsp. variegata TaxID=360336 RepID=A0A8T0CVG4_CORYI|nr:LOW QUALITY PROTEIN: hypothetical protein BT93_L3491 [Corymbia citriodora subsp. variegata]